MSNCCFAVLVKQCFKLISCDFLLLKKKCCTSVKNIAVLCYHALCLVVRLVDDFDKQGACLGHLLKIWADNYRFNAEIKGGMIRPCYTTLLVTSNYTPDQIFKDDAELCEAVTARFKVIKLENRAVHQRATPQQQHTSQWHSEHSATPEHPPCSAGSVAMCKKVWPYLTEAMRSSIGFEFMSAYKSSTNIRGDRDFYHDEWTNSKGYVGYLGVLMQGIPGFLSEGYFHTYQPARHRALNEDWCRQEGIRYYRGICAYFGTPADTRGCIMGMVKARSSKMNGYDCYTYKPDTHDQYLPLNGTEVRLRNAAGEEVARYTVDDNYNGVFVFYDLEPGIYKVDTKVDGYITSTTSYVKVTANKTTYSLIYKYKGESTEFEPATGIAEVKGFAGIAPTDAYAVYDLSGRMVTEGLYADFSRTALPRGTYVIRSGQLSYTFNVDR